MPESESSESPAVLVRCYSVCARWGLGASAGLVALVTALLISFYWADGWTAATVVISLLLLAMTTTGGLITAASIWNTVRVQVIGGDVVIETGPVPWTSRRTIFGNTIEQLYVQHAPSDKVFWPRLGGPYDVQARLNDGRWIRLVKGCRSEAEARRVERLVERALKRSDESGRIEDDDRSEIFSDWRETIGPPPRWLKVQRRGDTVQIRYRDTMDGIFLGFLRGSVAAALAGYVLATLSTWASFGGLVWLLILATGVAQALWAIIRRGSIVIDAHTLTRKGETIQRRDIGAIDCRSRTRLKRTSRWGTYRRVRHYFVEAHIAQRGSVSLTSDLRHRAQGLHIMRAILEALGREGS